MAGRLILSRLHLPTHPGASRDDRQAASSGAADCVSSPPPGKPQHHSGFARRLHRPLLWSSIVHVPQTASAIEMEMEAGCRPGPVRASQSRATAVHDNICKLNKKKPVPWGGGSPKAAPLDGRPGVCIMQCVDDSLRQVAEGEGTVGDFFFFVS